MARVIIVQKFSLVGFCTRLIQTYPQRALDGSFVSPNRPHRVGLASTMSDSRFHVRLWWNTLDPKPLRVILSGRLWLLLPLSSRARLLCVVAHHRAAYVSSGVLRRHGHALGSEKSECLERVGGTPRQPPPRVGRRRIPRLPRKVAAGHRQCSLTAQSKCRSPSLRRCAELPRTPRRCCKRGCVQNYQELWCVTDSSSWPRKSLVQTHVILTTRSKGRVLRTKSQKRSVLLRCQSMQLLRRQTRTAGLGPEMKEHFRIYKGTAPY